MYYNPLKYPYHSQRTVVFGKKGMVATSQPLAAQAGLQVMKNGGNAIDAAIAAAACLTVVEPTSNGIGGDAFAMVWSKGKLYGLNSSGPSPKSISIEGIKNKGYQKIPIYGWVPVTVPGAVAAWTELSNRFGNLPLKDLLSPAITYAYEGYPVSPTTAKYWKNSYERYKKDLNNDEFQYWFQTFSPQGHPPKAGEIWHSSDHGKTLEIIGETKGEDFYHGDLAEKIHKFSIQYGGFLRKEDLKSFKPQWVDPISINYRGYDVWEIPPNGQGLVALMALNILKGFEFSSKNLADTYHKQIEAIKIAFVDGQKYITDPKRMKIKIEELLSDGYGDKRRKLIRERAILPTPYTPPVGGTVYLATADEEGNMVSFIQSNYMDFGSGLVVPGTGIALHNRGHNFSMDPSHDNCLEPMKRPYHTIIPGFLTKNHNPIGPFGVMGAFMQPQGHLQVMMNTIDFYLNPQSALDAPRWQWLNETMVAVEDSFPTHISKFLSQLGHNIKYGLDIGSFGRGQIIFKNENNVLVGGTDPRTDGTIAVW